MAKEIRNNNINGRVTVYPDPTGRYRKSSAMHTDHKILSNNGFRVVSGKVTRNADDYNNVNGLLMNAQGEIRLTIDPSCKVLINDLNRMTYKKGTSDPDKSDLSLSHASDALKYIVNNTFPIQSFGYREESI